MNAQEIKKLYKKAKAAYEKRTGEQFVWYMNAKQQKQGTATICTACTVDAAERLKSRQSALDKQPARRAEYEKEITQRAATGDSFWKEKADPENMKRQREEELQGCMKKVDEAQQLLAAQEKNFGGYAGEVDHEIENAQKMIEGPEIQSFLEAIGGSAHVETIQHQTGRCIGSTDTYIRFNYKPEV